MSKASRAALAAAGIALGCLTTSAEAVDDIKFDWMGAQKNEIFRTWVYQARSCMRDGMQSQLHAGIRDSEKIINRLMPPCGGHLVKVLQQWYGKSEPDATLMVRELAKEELVRIVGPLSPAGAKAPEKGTRGR